MEAKKSKSADLESKRSIFLQIGLIVALGLTLAAFEWKTPVNKIAVAQTWDRVIEDVVIKIPVILDRKPLPQTILPPSIRIVDNSMDVKGDIELNVDIKPEDITPVYTPPVMTQLDDEKAVESDETFVIAEHMPEFPGGISALQEFLYKNIEFPAGAAQVGVQGTVYVFFIVEKDGSVSSIKTVRGIGGGCDEEAERVIRMLPKWTPGEQRGKPVRVSFNIPVIFKLK
jgi:periplasmic protein TonB